MYSHSIKVKTFVLVYDNKFNLGRDEGVWRNPSHLFPPLSPVCPFKPPYWAGGRRMFTDIKIDIDIDKKNWYQHRDGHYDVFKDSNMTSETERAVTHTHTHTHTLTHLPERDSVFGVIEALNSSEEIRQRVLCVPADESDHYSGS